MTVARIFLGILCISISACATNGASLPKISEVETASFIKQISAVSDAEMKAAETSYGMTIGYLAPPAVEWIQPLNKTDNCLIYFGGGEPWWNNTEFKAYWDGSCRQGYAHGTGREFVYANGELASSLATYQGGRNKPKYFLNVNYDRKTVHLQVESDTSIRSRLYQEVNISNEKQISITDSVADSNNKKLFQRFQTSGNDTSFSSVTLPNGYRYVRENNINPISYGTVWGVQNRAAKYVGYSVGHYQNPLRSNLVHAKIISNSSIPEYIRLPDNYLSHITEVHNEIDQTFGYFEQSLQEAMVAINKYKRRICKGGVSVDYIDDGIYGRICLENGELNPFQKIMTRNFKGQEVRHKRDRTSIKQQLAQRSRDQQIAAAQRARDVAAINQQLNSLNETIRQGTNDLTRTMNSFQAPKVDFGNSRQSTTTCNTFGSTMVRCKTQY